MNENENNVTELQNGSTMGPTPAPTPQPVEMPTPAAVEAPTPVIEPVSSTPEPTPVVELVQTPAPKKNKKLLIIVLVVVLLLGVGAWYVFTQTDLLDTNTKEESRKSDKKKDKNKDKEDDEDEDDDNDIDDDDDDDTPSPGYEELKEYNGVYTLGNNTVKLYPLENETILYLINDEAYGFAVYKDDKVIDDTWGEDETVQFQLGDNGLSVKSYENPSVDGTYTKTSAYEAKDIIDDKFGSYELFNNSFNGYYTMKDDDMYTFQIDEDTVRVIILSANTFSSFDLEFDIVDDKTIETEFFDDYYKMTFNGDTIQFTSEGEDHDHDGTYKRESSVGVEELLEIGMI